MNALTFSLLIKLKFDRSISDQNNIIALDGRLIPIKGILFKICNVFSRPQTRFRETPKKRDKKRFRETADVKVDTEVSAAEFRVQAEPIINQIIVQCLNLPFKVAAWLIECNHAGHIEVTFSYLEKAHSV